MTNLQKIIALEPKKLKIAIDGPSGAGKSSVARELAQRLGLLYVDTGAVYRGAAVYFLRNGVDINDEHAIVELCGSVKLEYAYENGKANITIDGEDVTTLLRTEQVSDAASRISTIPELRSWVSVLQKELGRSDKVVMDGRDVGTVIMPNAHVKIYLDASVTERAKRRMLQLKLDQSEFIRIIDEIEQRDYRDTHREASPLAIAPDSVVVDSSGLGFDETLDKICGIVLNNLVIIK